MSLHSLTLHELHDKLKKKEITSAELTESVFQRISSTEDRLHSFITLCREGAHAEAKRADALAADTQRGERALPAKAFPPPFH